MRDIERMKYYLDRGDVTADHSKSLVELSQIAFEIFVTMFDQNFGKSLCDFDLYTVSSLTSCHNLVIDTYDPKQPEHIPTSFGF